MINYTKVMLVTLCLSYSLHPSQMIDTVDETIIANNISSKEVLLNFKEKDMYKNLILKGSL